MADTPAATKVTILGITEDSFAVPRVLLTAEVGNDRGYFGEKLSNARQKLQAEWQRRSVSLECNAHRTDILGALLLTSQILHEHPADNAQLVIFSDMRQSAKELNLETTKAVQFDSVLKRFERRHLVADLRGVDVEIKGADNAGSNLISWVEIEDLWQRYFQIANAALTKYDALR